MFQIPLADQALTVEGYPFVQLHQDRGADLVLLFTLLYDGYKHSIFRQNDTIEFKALRALVRLASKYEIPHLQREMTTRLRQRSSVSLGQWDEEVDSERSIKMRPHDAIAVVVLARAYD
ncbi:hypothetical protein PHLGIDRAFT_202032 [Phlebiopsis gigantea 11061_1 CR5-6]|uniref:Uncharacterized protein n=1 Tax=Phlebiopsis gigantea (strain 11061_1 CR5-6) TaxID=745531 RepID=A0A0C3NHH2_PHLG1|nr:hypothetical protein PHLGIDRAFT_202032 [Phlebiopsis gigantea 11061_1 CR5-6]